MRDSYKFQRQYNALSRLHPTDQSQCQAQVCVEVCVEYLHARSCGDACINRA